MTIESSHGKARPTLVRSNDLRVVPAADDRSRNHDERGRVTKGNTLSKGKGWKRALRRMLGPDATDVEARAVADDAWRLFTASLAEMPHDGQNVRALIMRKARHEALSAYWSAKASLLGLATEQGIAAEDLATKHGQRAERLTVTALDVARVLADKHSKKDRIAELRAEVDGAGGSDGAA